MKKNIGKKLLSILVAALVVLGSLPGGSYVRAAEQIAAPENYGWGGGINIQEYFFEFDGIEDPDVKEYSIKAYYSSTGNTASPEKGYEGAITPDEMSENHGGVDLADMFNELKPGYYWVDLQTIPTDESGKENSDVVRLGPTPFYTLEVTYKDLDEEGQEITDEEVEGGTVFIEDSSGSGAQMKSTVQKLFLRGDEAYKLSANAASDEGFVFKELQGDLAEKTLPLNLNIDKSYSFTAVFQKTNEKASVSFDFGSKHTALAGTVREGMEERDALYTVEVYAVSVDGAYKEKEPYIIENVASGTTLGSIVDANKNAIKEQFAKDGYSFYNVCIKSWNELSENSYNLHHSSVTQGRSPYNQTVTGDTNLYAMMTIDVSEVNFKVDPIKCNTETSYPPVHPLPGGAKVTITEENPGYYFNQTRWLTSLDNDESRYSGIVDEDTIAYISFDANWGYQFTEDVKVNVEGATLAKKRLSIPWPPYKERLITYEQPCTIEHDWDMENGKVTKEPTVDAEGEMTYKCKLFDTCGGTKTEPIPALDVVARNVETQKDYATVQAAVDEAKDGQTVQLIKDEIELEEGVVISKNITLDLNGKTISWNGYKSPIFGTIVISGANKDVTIKDSVGGGRVLNTSSGGYAVWLAYSNSKLTIESGTFENPWRMYGLHIHGTLTMTGGKVKGGTAGIESSGKVYISGGEVEGKYYGLEHYSGQNAEAYISGGTIRTTEKGHNSYGAIRATGGKIEVSGGTLDGGVGISLHHMSEPWSNDVTVDITGGTIDGAIQSLFMDSPEHHTINIKGGRFSDQEGNKENYNRLGDRQLILEEDGDHYVLTPVEFKEIVWSDKDTAEPKAKAVFIFGDEEKEEKEFDCVVTSEGDSKSIKYTATLAADKSPDGEEHTDTYTLYKVFNLYVQGVHVTGENCDNIPVTSGKVSYDPKTNTLTLENATIEMSRRSYGFSSGDKQEYGIRSNLGNADAMPGGTAVTGPLTIKLIGENNIVNSEKDEETTNQFGIVVTLCPLVTYTGGGTLNISMTADEDGKNYFGVEPHQSTAFDGVTLNVNIDGTAGNINAMRAINDIKVSLENGANMHLEVDNGYAVYSNTQSNQDLSVGAGCVFEAISGGANGALYGDDYVQLTDDTKALGAMVNENATATGRSEWDGTTDLSTYKYVRIPGIPSITVNYDLGEGHEELAQAETLKTAINSRHAMEVLEVDGSVVKIRVPELSDNNTKNTVARLLGALQVALNESVGHDPWYGPYWVYDQKQWNFNNALKTLENYSSIDDVNDEHDAAYKNGTMPEDGQTIYALWAEPISEVAIDVEAPLCGTEVTADLRDTENPDMGYDEETQTPQPVVSISTEHVSIYEEDGWEYTWWVDQTRKEEAGFTILPPCYIGTMEGDNDYMMIVTVEPDFGYYLPEDVKFTTSKGTVDEELSHGIDSFADAYITITAEHEEGEPVEENRVEPTCEEAGSYDEVVYCLHHDTCGKELSRETRTIDALGHDWGEPTYEWAADNSKVTATRVCKNDKAHVETETVETTSQTTKEPTATEKGEKTYTGTFTNPAFATQTKTEEIPAKGEDPAPVTPDVKTFSITFDPNGGTIGGSTKPVVIEYEEGEEITIPVAPKRDGYTFQYWEGSKHYPGDKYVVKENHTFKAIWKADSKKAVPAKTITPAKASPKTGDENKPLLWIVLLAVALGVLFVIVKKRKGR